MDENSPHSVKSLVPEVANAELVKDDCIQHLYCGMPYLMPAMSLIWYVHDDRILDLLYNAVTQCFSTAGPWPGTGPWHQLYRAVRGSGICHFSFLSISHE
jgi:hypothetical protein